MVISLNYTYSRVKYVLFTTDEALTGSNLFLERELVEGELIKVLWQRLPGDLYRRDIVSGFQKSALHHLNTFTGT